MLKYGLIFLSIIAIVIIFYIVVNKRIKNEIVKSLNNVKNYEFKKLNKHIFDYTLENDERIIYFKVVIIPSNSSITINSKTTWCLTWGGSKSNKGRSYPNKCYLNEVIPAINFEIKNDKKVIKVFLLYKSCEHMYKYRNESDIDEINSSNTPYGYKLITFENLEKEFENLFVDKPIK